MSDECKYDTNRQDSWIFPVRQDVTQPSRVFYIAVRIAATSNARNLPAKRGKLSGPGCHFGSAGE